MSNPKFKFSIIMSVYNVESYIAETFESILHQTIGFSNNIQIVVVNDGSTDNSADICKRYQSLHPANIVYLEQENRGLSAARNLGIASATGEYLNFLDPDDTLSENALDEVLRFFEKHHHEVDLVTIPLVYFEAQTGLHPKYRHFKSSNRVIDLAKEPHNFLLSSAATFYKREVVPRDAYDVSLTGDEDTLFNTQLMQQNASFGYVCENNVRYNYRRRASGGSNVDKVKSGSDTRVFSGVLQMLDRAIEDPDNLKPFEKEIIAYVLRSRLREVKPKFFESPEDFDSLIEKYANWIKKLDLEFICQNSKFIDSIDKKALFLKLKGSSIAEAVERSLISKSELKAYSKTAYYSETCFVVDMLFYNYGCDLDLVAVSENGEIVLPAITNDIPGSFEKTYGDFKLDIAHHRKFEFPLTPRSYIFCLEDKRAGKLTEIINIIPDIKPPIMNKGGRFAYCKNGFGAYFSSAQLTIVKKERTLGTEAALCREQRKARQPVPYLRLFNRPEKKYVLISDRPEKAGDNGQALFEHIMTHGDDDLKRVTYFVLDKNCPDYEHLSRFGHIVQPRSLKHKLLFLNAKIVYTSHNAYGFFMPFAHNGKYYADLFGYKLVWLQHGITQNDVSSAANRLNTHNDFVVTASPYEKREFDNPKYYLGSDRVLLTGFARFDKLVSHPEKTITIAPTWRSNLSGKILKNGYHEPLPNFEMTDYFKVFSEFLKSPKLNALLHSTGYKLNFVPHPGIACYEQSFKQFENDFISVIKQEDVVYSDIFEKSSLFVTDYSSTAFDFAYLKKPIIYFQFDEEEFFQEHYTRGYYDYRKNGFGPVVSTVDELIDCITEALNNNCTADPKYMNRIETFFAHTDQNCCKRILEATL